MKPGARGDVRQLKFTIQAFLPSARDFDSGRTWRTKWGRQKQLKKTFFWAIKEGLQKAGFYFPGNTSYFKGRVRIDLVVFQKSRRSEKDEDNIIRPAGKLIVDQLFEAPTQTKKHPRRPVANILVGDEPEWLKWGEVEQKTGQPDRVEVTLTELEH